MSTFNLLLLLLLVYLLDRNDDSSRYRASRAKDGKEEQEPADKPLHNQDTKEPGKKEGKQPKSSKKQSVFSAFKNSGNRFFSSSSGGGNRRSGRSGGGGRRR